MTRLYLLVALAVPAAALADPVQIRRVPDGGIQPQVAVGGDGALHLVYFRGDARGGDLFYVRSTDGGESFSTPLRVNAEAGSAVAVGTIRGAHLALGREDRVHVAWNGAAHGGAYGAPMLYSRLDVERNAFEPQRNLMTKTRSLDGGGSVAADRRGNVYVVWHAASRSGKSGEEHRVVWIARSSDGGATFSSEARANRKDTGACGCCGLRAFADDGGTLYAFYRTATRVLDRDMHLLISGDRGESFRGSRVDAWRVPKCVMSMAAFTEGPRGVLAAWETEEEVYFGLVDPETSSIPRRVRAAGAGKGRKHPVLAVNARGETLLAWTEGTGWKRGGALAWQLYDESDAPVAAQSGRRDGVPVWSFPAVFSTPKGTFVVLY